MNIKTFNLTAQGASHIKHDKVCQDASASFSSDRCHIAVVCDGHGGDDYVRSDIGSKVACKIAIKNMREFVDNTTLDDLRLPKERAKRIRQLKESIIGEWNEEISDYHRDNPFTEFEVKYLSPKAKRRYVDENKFQSAYGTTLIAVVVTPTYWLGIHVGDGKCVAVNPAGKFMQPIPWDDKCFLNVTTSICDEDALERSRDFCSPNLPLAVFVGSDGIDDCFKNDEQMYDLYRTVLYSFASSEFNDALEELRNYLPRLSKKGSGDDVSVAAILNMDKIGEIESVKQFNREEKKAQVEEHVRAEEEAKRLAAEERKRRDEERARRQGIHPEANLITCPKCGTKLQSNAKYCLSCGTKIGKASEAPAPEPSDVPVEPVIPEVEEIATEAVEQPEPVIFEAEEIPAAIVEQPEPVISEPEEIPAAIVEQPEPVISEPEEIPTAAVDQSVPVIPEAEEIPTAAVEHPEPVLAEAEADMVTCPTCGISVPSNDQFCTDCGINIEIASQAAVSAPSDEPVEPMAEEGRGDFLSITPRRKDAPKQSEAEAEVDSNAWRGGGSFLSLPGHTPAPAVEDAPAEKSAPVIEAAPAEEAAPIEKSSPVIEDAPAEEVAPIEKSSPVIEDAPAEEAAPIEKSSPVIEAAPSEEAAPIEKSSPVIEDAPAEESAPIEKSSPVIEDAPAEEAAPIEKSAPVIEAAPAEESAPIEKEVPVEDFDAIPSFVTDVPAEDEMLAEEEPDEDAHGFNMADIDEDMSFAKLPWYDDDAADDSLEAGAEVGEQAEGAELACPNPKCRAAISAGENFCPECGAYIPRN